MSLATWSKMVSMLGVFRQNYQICITFTAILKYNHRYRIVQCHTSLCKHVIWMKQLNREDNNVLFDLLMMKIDQLFITTWPFVKKITENVLPTLYHYRVLFFCHPYPLPTTRAAQWHLYGIGLVLVICFKKEVFNIVYIGIHIETNLWLRQRCET